MLLSNQYSLLCLHHTRIRTLCCLPSSIYNIIRPIKLAENIFIKDLLVNAFSVSRYTISKES